MSKSGRNPQFARFVIVIFPNILYFVVLGPLILITPLLGLTWQFFPGHSLISLWRLMELVIGQFLLVLTVMFITWGTISLGMERAQGEEIGQVSADPGFVTSGAYAYCRHPITFGFIFASPAIALTFDFVPFFLQAIVYTPMMLALLIYEERELVQRFGDEYKTYQRNVPLLIPRRKH